MPINHKLGNIIWKAILPSDYCVNIILQICQNPQIQNLFCYGLDQSCVLFCSEIAINAILLVLHFNIYIGLYYYIVFFYLDSLLKGSQI